MYKFIILITSLIIILLVSCKKQSSFDIVRDKTNEKTQQVDYVLDTSLSLEEYANEEGSFPQEGFVPTAKIAFQIAEPVLNNIFGKVHIENEKPFSINLENDIWIIKGTLYSRKGGVAYMEIRKDNGEILKVIHEK
jgi:hypothetical protein